MPCYRCGRVQTDPVRGATSWARGLVDEELVLVCPQCQSDDPDWAGALARCTTCGSTRLTKVLGVVTCRACGAEADEDRVWEPSDGS